MEGVERHQHESEDTSAVNPGIIPDAAVSAVLDAIGYGRNYPPSEGVRNGLAAALPHLVGVSLVPEPEDDRLHERYEAELEGVQKKLEATRELIIEAWHDEGFAPALELHEALGMTLEEYGEWLNQ
jgi:hypothetical protein